MTKRLINYIGTTESFQVYISGQLGQPNEIKPLLTNTGNDEQRLAEVQHQPPTLIIDPVEPLSLYREADIFFESASPTHGFYSVRDRWALLEREELLADVENPLPKHPMPVTPIFQLINLVRENPYFRGDWTGFYAEFLDQRPDENTEDIRAFVETVEDTRVLSINTVGTNLIISDRFGRTRPRVMLSVGTLTGQVLFFNDVSIVDPRILNFIQSPTYVKIGSQLDSVFKELERVDVLVRNWVETGAMRLALYPPTWTPDVTKVPPKIGAMHYDVDIQIEDLLEAGYLQPPYSRTPFNKDWCRDPTFAARGRIPPDMLPHLIENVRIPCAEAILIVAHFATQRHYSMSEPFFPILFEAFGLCHGRDPKDLQRTLDPPRPEVNYWMALLPVKSRLQQSTIPASCWEASSYRNAMADFVEPVRSNFNPTEISQVVFKRFFGPNGIEFPAYRVMTAIESVSFWTNRCLSCARIGHSVKDCLVNKNPTCDYEHDGEICEPHSILCCPVLHGYCLRCLTNGHHERVHYVIRHLKTQRELRQRFFRFMEHGLLSSIPFLILHPEGRKKLSSSHWKPSYDAKKYLKALITRYVLGVDKHISSSELSEHVRKQSNSSWRSAMTQKLEAIRRNVSASTYNFEPLARNNLPIHASKCKSKPAERAQTVQTASPAQTAQTAAPALLALPAEPSPSTQPASPVQMAQPARPAQTAQPTVPEQMGQPAKPSPSAQPTSPVQMAQLAKPSPSAQPASPVVMVQPALPVKLAQPAIPEQMVHTARPAQTAQPARPAQMVQPAKFCPWAEPDEPNSWAQPAEPSPWARPTEAAKSVETAKLAEQDNEVFMLFKYSQVT